MQQQQMLGQFQQQNQQFIGSGPAEGNFGDRTQQNNEYLTEDKLNFIVDLLADDFCELDDSGNYVIKPEAKAMFIEQEKAKRKKEENDEDKPTIEEK